MNPFTWRQIKRHSALRHIGPGYTGLLQFTVINMGRSDYVLRRKDPIVTLLIFQLGRAVDADYASRHPGSVAASVTQDSIDRLSPDFVDVQKRATEIARKTLGDTTIGASVLAVLLGWAFNAIDKKVEGIDEIKTRLTKLEDDNLALRRELQSAQAETEKKIDVDHRLLKIEGEAGKKGMGR